MKYVLVLLVVLASPAGAGTDPGVADLLREASTCSDASLTDFAARTCEPPEKIAAMAIAKCQARWNAFADKAIGPAPPAAGDAVKGHGRSLKIYARAMEDEYIRVAELKAIDMRTAAGRCGFE